MGRVVGGEEATHGLHHHEVVGGRSGSPQFKAAPQLHVGGKLNGIGSLGGRVRGGQNLTIIPTSTYRITGKFGGELNLAVYTTTAKLKSAKISYSHIYVWRSRTEPPNLNPPIFLQ